MADQVAVQLDAPVLGTTKPPRAWDPPNLLLVTLAVTVTLPFSQPTWPVPTAKATSSTIRPVIHQHPQVLVGKDQFFGAPGMGPDYDWPNPQGKPFPRVLLTHTDSFKLELLGKDQFFGPAGMGPDYDWPNPRAAAAPPRSLYHFPCLALEPVIVATLPFASTDWPVPSGKTGLRSLTQWTEVRKQFYADLQPFAQSDWPTPALIPRLRDLTTWALNLQEGTLGIVIPASPNNQFDWPLPQGKSYPVSLRTWLKDRPQFYLDLVPAHLTEWPLPTGMAAHRELRTFINNLLESTLNAAPPITQNDWPLPTGKPYPVVLRTWVDWREQVLVDPIPTGRLRDWPNPRRAAPFTDLRHFLNTLIALPTGVVYPAVADFVVLARADDHVILASPDDTVMT